MLLNRKKIGLAGNGVDGGGGLAGLEPGWKRGASAVTYGCVVTRGSRGRGLLQQWRREAEEMER